MSKLLSLAPALLLPLVLMSACGSGSNAPAPSESPSSSSLSTSSTSLATVSVSSTSSSSLATNLITEKVSGIIEFTDVDGSAIDVEDTKSVTITLSLLDEKDQVIVAKPLNSLNTVAADSSVPFSGEVSGAGAKFLVVQISKPGFTDYARRFDVAAELNIKATLSQVPTEKISASTAVTISGTAVDGFNFSVSDKDNPVVAGIDGGVADLTVSIPKSALPEGTTRIDVGMQAFNPNDAEDAEKFPGAYADSDGNKLLSVAFNYTDITTDTGVSLKKLAASAKGRKSLQKSGRNKAEAEPVIINRKIPEESCSALRQMGDSSREIAGFQVPVYSYDAANGLWDLLGQGTLYSASGLPIAENFKDFDCAVTEYVLEIRVSNEIFLSNWWNLDYPLVFSQPVELCADIQLVDEASQPIANNMVFVSDNDDERSFSAENFVTDENGKLHIEIYSLDPVVADTHVELMLYSKNYTSAIKQTITLSPSCAVATPVVIKTILPAVCKVEGSIKDTTGQLVKNSMVYAGATSEGNEAEGEFFMPAYGMTDNEGKYSLEVSCNQNYNLVDYLAWIGSYSSSDSALHGYTFSVNSNVTANEASDNGKVAVLKEMTADRSRPIGYVYSDAYDSKKIILDFFYAGSSFPLTYSFDAIDENNGKVYANFSGTITKDDLKSSADTELFYIPFNFVEVPNTIVWPLEYVMLTVKGEIKDAGSGKSELSGFIYNSEYSKE